MISSVEPQASQRNLPAELYFSGQSNFQAYYQAYYNRLFTHAYQYVRNHDRANELVNDILMKVGGITDGSYEYNPNKSHLSYLLTAVARRAICDNRKVANRDFINESDFAFADEGANSIIDLNTDHSSDEDDMINVIDDDDERTGFMLAVGMYMLQQTNKQPLIDAILSNASDGEEYKDIVDRYEEINTVGAIKTMVCRFRKRAAEKLQQYDLFQRVMNGSNESGNFVAFCYNRRTGKAHMSRTGTFLNGQFHGWVTEYHPSGNVKSKIKYSGGAIINTSAKYFDDEGNTVKVEKYDSDGNMVEVTMYEAGEVVTQYIFSAGTLTYAYEHGEEQLFD